MADVRIGVSADTKGLDSGLDNTAKGVDKVTDAVDDLGKGARRAAQEIDRVEVSARRLERVQKILQAELGRTVSPEEARSTIDRFEEMRQNRHLTGGAKIRQFRTFEDWHSGNASMFVDPREADRYRRRIITMATGSVPVAPGGGGGGGGGVWGTPDTPGSNMMRSGMRGAMRVGGGLLALSGIMGVMSMAGRAVEQSRGESMSTDQLLRSVGDVTGGFEDMRRTVRDSTRDLGVAFTDAAEMARQFAKEADADANVNIGTNLRTGMGMGRAYGLDPRVGVGFMAQMRHYGGIGGDDPSGRRMALLVAEAIERGGVTAKADELMSAVANFTTQVARLTLTNPNVAGFAGAMAGLTGMNVPGLGPNEAANMLMTANAAMARGGGMGEAGQNFTYGALTRAHGNINPMLAMAIAEQGLFGSGQSLANSRLGQFYAGRGMDVSGLSGTTNLELIRQEIDRQYGNSPLALDAFKNYFGLQSQGQALALYEMRGARLGGLEGLVGAAGLDVSQVSATGIQKLADIGAADPMTLRLRADEMMGRSDISDAERSRLGQLRSGTDTEALRTEMARIVATREQEANIGTDIRNSTVNIENKLTEIGAKVLPLIETIQSSVVKIANTLAPTEKTAWESTKDNAAAALMTLMSPATTARMLTQSMRESGGGDLPASNPAGSPSGSSRSVLDLNLTGRFLDMLGRPAAELDDTSVQVPLPNPAGVQR